MILKKEVKKKKNELETGVSTSDADPMTVFCPYSNINLAQGETSIWKFDHLSQFSYLHTVQFLCILNFEPDANIPP